MYFRIDVDNKIKHQDELKSCLDENMAKIYMKQFEILLPSLLHFNTLERVLSYKIESNIIDAKQSMFTIQQ